MFLLFIFRFYHFIQTAPLRDPLTGRFIKGKMSSNDSTPKDMATKSEVQEMKSMFVVLMIKMAEMSTEMQTMKQNHAGSTSVPHIAPAVNLNAVPLQTPLVPIPKEIPIQQKACSKYDSENEGSWYGGSSDESEDEAPKENDPEIVPVKARHSKTHDKYGKSTREEERERKMADMEIAQEEMRNQLKQMAKGKNIKVGHDWEKGLREASKANVPQGVQMPDNGKYTGVEDPILFMEN